jgi:hypothetical protein
LGCRRALLAEGFVMTSSIELAAFRSQSPRCAAPLHGQCEIDWDDEKREFRVKVHAQRSPKDEREPLAILIEMAEHSQCACGGALRLRNHRIVQMQAQAYTIEATYTCAACSERGLFRSFFRGLWASTKKVEVRANGVVFEKK